MTANERFINLLRKLRQATRMKRIAWSDTADEYTFRLSFNDGMIQIGAVEEPNAGGTALRATLFNQNNTPVETVTEFPSSTSDAGILLSELYTLARESALRPDDVLASIDAELDQRMKEAAVR